MSDRYLKYLKIGNLEVTFNNPNDVITKKTKKIKRGKMNFNFEPKSNPRNTFLEHCVNKGKNFEVEIVHWKMMDEETRNKLPSAIALMGNECWNVYATINKRHPLYERMKDVETDDYSDAMDKFPFEFHCGITYIHNNEDNIKIGDDYMHYGDEYFQKCEELPSEVRIEAEELFKFLSEYKGE